MGVNNTTSQSGWFWVGTSDELVRLSAGEIMGRFEKGEFDAQTPVRITPSAPSKPLMRYIRELVLTATADFETAVGKDTGLFEAAFAKAPIGMVYSDLGGTILHCNHSFSTMLGYAQEELEGMRVGELSTSDSRDAEVALGMQLLSGLRDHFEIEKGFIARDGTTVMTKTAIALIRDDTGVPAAVVAHILDVRGTRELQARLEAQREATQRSEERFERLFMSAPQAMLIVGPENTIVQANQRAEKLFDASDRGLTMTPVLDVLHLGDADFSPSDGASDAPPSDLVAELPRVRGQTLEGREFHATVGHTAIRLNERDCMILGVSDVSREVEATSALEQSLRDQEFLVREVHHRVKNNLAVVRGLLQMQASRVSHDEAAQALDESARRVSSMAAVHERLYTGGGSSSAVDLEAFLRDICLSLQQAYSPQCIMSVRADRLSLGLDKAVPVGLIINELVTNALKYGIAKVLPSALPADIEVHLGAESDAVVLTVTDYGPGFDSESPEAVGTGFGMQLVKALCRQLRGELRYIVSGGTTATLRFPHVHEPIDARA